MTPTDNHARKEALNPTKSFIVQAPAGSGKTEILSQRYLNLLAHVETPEEIIALTFTNKAASEMQHRIYQALLSVQNSSEPEEPHKKLTYKLAQKALMQNDNNQWQLLKNPKRLRIMTIDAFCQLLSKLLIFKTDEAFDATITDAPELLYEQAIYKIINNTEEQSTHYQDFYLLLSHLDNDITRVKDLLGNMLSKREQWLGVLLKTELTYNKDQTSKLRIESGFYALFIKLVEQATEILKLEKNQLMFTQILQFCDEQNKQYSNTNETLSVHQHNPVFWQKIIKLLFTNYNTFRKKFNASQGLPAKNMRAKAYSQWLIKYVEQFSDLTKIKIYSIISELRMYERILFNDNEWQILSAIARIALHLSQQLKLVFKEEALIDFNELSLQALSGLGSRESPTNLLLYLDYQIKHLLIDEFQDTSILQFKLLEMLTLEWQPNDQNTLFIVGDPMQSIYRFRQAEVNQFVEVKTQGINKIKLNFLQLNCNFRSQKSIVDWINQNFCQIFPLFDDINHGGISYSHATTLSKSVKKDAVTCSLFNNMENEALYIASTIKNYLKEYPTHQIAILLRTRSHLKKIIPTLKSYEIDLVENEIETFYQHEMVMDLISICAILGNPQQTIYWTSLLQSSLFGFSLNELNQIQKTILYNEPTNSFYQKLITYLQDHQTHAHEQKAYYFLAWLENNNFSGLNSPLINRLKVIWQLLDGLTIYSKNYLYINFLSLLDQHLTKDKTEIKNFDRFTATLKRKFVSSPAKANVSIMTIHKSKGLEFDYVILPQLDKCGKANDAPIFLHETLHLSNHKTHLLLGPIKHAWDKDDSPLYTIIQSMQKKRTEYELQRLLYVAITRAKSKLLLTGVNNSEKDLNPKSNSLLALLEPLNLYWNLSDSSNEISSHIIYCYKSVKQIQNYSITAVPKCNNHLSELQSNNLNHPSFDQLVLTKERQLGLALHQLFKFLCLNLNNIRNWQDYFLLCLHQHAISKKLQNTALTQAKLSINNTIKQFPWVFNAKGMSEQIMFNISFNKVKTYIADRIIINEGQYHIIDYKFTTPKKQEHFQSFLATQELQYKEQLRNYQKLITIHFKIDKRMVKISLYFPLIPYLQRLN